jgi:hypothetical protein
LFTIIIGLIAGHSLIGLLLPSVLACCRDSYG